MSNVRSIALINYDVLVKAHQIDGRIIDCLLYMGISQVSLFTVLDADNINNNAPHPEQNAEAKSQSQYKQLKNLLARKGITVVDTITPRDNLNNHAQIANSEQDNTSLTYKTEKSNLLIQANAYGIEETKKKMYEIFLTRKSNDIDSIVFFDDDLSSLGIGCEIAFNQFYSSLNNKEALKKRFVTCPIKVDEYFIGTYYEPLIALCEQHEFHQLALTRACQEKRADLWGEIKSALEHRDTKLPSLLEILKKEKQKIIDLPYKKTYFNPFSFLFETNTYHHARFWRTSFWGKLKDTFCVFSGDVFISNYKSDAGLLDYVTLGIPRFLIKFSEWGMGYWEESSSMLRKVLSFPLVALGFIIEALTSVSYAPIAALLTIAVSPIVFIAHLFSKKIKGDKLKAKINAIVLRDADNRGMQEAKTFGSYNKISHELYINKATILKDNAIKLRFVGGRNTTKEAILNLDVQTEKEQFHALLETNFMRMTHELEEKSQITSRLFGKILDPDHQWINQGNNMDNDNITVDALNALNINDFADSWSFKMEYGF